MSYKKRAREGWETGKHHKKIANQSERMFAKEEIRNELNQIEAGEEFREKGSSRKKSVLERLENLLVGIQARKERSAAYNWSWLTPSWYDAWMEKVKTKIGRLKK
jgi:L-lactate utilization protein LutB